MPAGLLICKKPLVLCFKYNKSKKDKATNFSSLVPNRTRDAIHVNIESIENRDYYLYRFVLLILISRSKVTDYLVKMK